MQADPEFRSPNREHSARTVPSRVLRLRPTVAAVSGGCVGAAGVVRPRVPCASKLDLSGGVKTVHVLEINELLVGVAKRDKTEINR